MKKRLLLSAGLISLLFVSCSIEEDINLQNEIEPISNSAQNSNSSSVPIPDVIPNEMVIQFIDKNLNEKEKDIIVENLENDYNFVITHRETCDCDKDGLELWKVNLKGSKFSRIEDAVAKIDDKTGIGAVEADLNFYFQINHDLISRRYTSTLVEKTVTSNPENAVNIAILDTGVDYDFFPEPFLYNSRDTSVCEDEISGWDFINGDNDPRDDQGHGTAIAKIITNQLEIYSVPYTIMAVKSFNHEGIGSYWSITCGINHIAKKQQPFIVNTSFGFYSINRQDIFKNIIDDASDRLLIISSAGNMGIDTDISGNEHFPSGYNADNVLTVGGYVEQENAVNLIHGETYISNVLRAANSNFGRNAIDVLAPFGGYNIKLVDASTQDTFVEVIVEGTSFASAYTTARAGQLHNGTSGSPLTIKTKTVDSGYPQQDLLTSIGSGRVITRNQIFSPPIRSLN